MFMPVVLWVTVTLNLTFNCSCNWIDCYVRRQNIGAKGNVSKKSKLNALESFGWNHN